MEDILSKTQNEPLVLFLIIVGLIAIATIFLIPVFLKYLKSSKYKFAQKKLTIKFNLNIKSKIKSPKYIIVSLLVVVFVVGIGYLAYDFFLAPIRIVSAWQIKLEKGSQLSKLQDGGLASWPKAKIYLLDLRDRDSYAKDHLVGSESLPANIAAIEFYPIDKVTLVVYSSKSNLAEARIAAEGIVKNGGSGKIKYNQPGRIIIIKYGFESLKDAGLKTEGGVWD